MRCHPDRSAAEWRDLLFAANDKIAAHQVGSLTFHPSQPALVRLNFLRLPYY